MKFLKRKIEIAVRSRLAKLQSKSAQTPETTDMEPQDHKKEYTKMKNKIYQNKQRLKKRKLKESIETKNIVKNYGRAIANFAISETAAPYLTQIKEFGLLSKGALHDYCNKMKTSICSFNSLRAAVMLDQSDPSELVNVKKVFRRIAEIFLKFFSVNWIFGGKLLYRNVYLKHRGPLLRGILYPEQYTSIKRVNV